MFFRLKRLWRRKITAVYSSAYILGSADVQALDHFDPQRYKKIRDHLIAEGLLRYRDFVKPPSVSREQLRLVHTDEYVQKLSDPISVAGLFGIGNASPWDNSLSEFFKTISGGTVWGALEMLRRPEIPVFNLAGGFHHAHPDKAEGYCLINDVVIAIRCMRKRNEKLKIMVVDLDYHQGNGILRLLKEDKLSYTFSIDAVRWIDCLKGNNTMLKVEKGCEDDEYLELLTENLPLVLDDFRPDVLIYLAGADVFADDFLGDLNLSEAGMLKRDMFVFDSARERGISILSLPAGGYGEKSWIPFFNFMKTVIKKENPYGNQ
jgi:acetoin utilization deacetylase AcuC-like enzyme